MLRGRASPPQKRESLLMAYAENRLRSTTIYSFGHFRLDASRRVLIAGHDVRPIPEKLFQILLLLLEASGGVVTKERFFASVWPDEIISDGNLAQHVFLLRKFLGDEGETGRYIITVPRKGYRLTLRSNAPVAAADEATHFDALNLYCRASHHLEKRTAAEVERARGLFEACLDLEGSYGPAWIGLARAHALRAEFAYGPPSPAFLSARIAIEKALAFEPDSEIAHALAAEIALFGDWNFSAAEQHLQAALDLNAQSLFARHTLAWYYLCSGAFEDAIAEAGRVLAVEPASAVFLLVLGRACMFSGDLPHAIACYSSVLESDPDDVWARTLRAIASIFSGSPASAIDDLRAIRTNGPEVPLLIRAYVDAGNERAAAEKLKELRGLAQSQYVSHWDFAIAHAALQQYDTAFDRLVSAIRAKEPLMLLLPALAPLFGSLAKQPRFQQLTVHPTRK
jgi:DNA-binding winged helix-turn-helix (wHTH) protein/lipoprotein NlpI